MTIPSGTDKLKNSSIVLDEKMYPVIKLEVVPG